MERSSGVFAWGSIYANILAQTPWTALIPNQVPSAGKFKEVSRTLEEWVEEAFLSPQEKRITFSFVKQLKKSTELLPKISRKGGSLMLSKGRSYT